MRSRHAFCLLLLLAISLPLLVSTPVAQAPASSHVVFVLLENHDYSSIVGNKSMPNLNNLISKGGLATQYYANTHPSIGNYFMLTTGQIITNDDTFAGTVTVDNLVRELLASAKTWKSYAQSLPYDGYLGETCCPYYPYAPYHNPFVYFSDVRNNNAQALNIVRFETHFASDVSNNQLPNYSFVLPDVQHDGHDCPPGKKTCTDAQRMSYVDTWLQTYVFTPLLGSAPFKSGGDGILVVVFDESGGDNTNGGGRVVFTVAGPGEKSGYQSTYSFYQHQSGLKLACDALGIACPGAGATAPGMGEFFIAAPTVSFTASPTSILLGQTSTLSWSTTSASTVTIDQGIGAVAASGSLAVAPVSTTTYTLTATNAAGSVSRAATVTVFASDSTPPSVAITAPADGTAVSGPITVAATASDNVAVAGVQFKLDGANLGAEVTAAPYSLSWDTTAVTNGTHTLAAAARDAAGNTTTSTPISVTVNNTAAPIPIVIGAQIAGTFGDASGHSAQSHLVYAANAGVWWLFTLTSTADSQGGSNHIVKSYHSSGPNLATATWTAGLDSPGASTAASAWCVSCFMGGGRALGVAYVDNSPTDIVHAEIAMAYDGQNGLTAHIRATVTASSITWEPWNYHDEPAATWTLPRAVTLGASTGKYIHSAGPILQQEVDANARTSTSSDIGSAWTSGFSSVSVIDNSMINANNAFAFAPLANNVMLAVYDNGGGTSTCYNCGQQGAPEPNLTNLGYKKSNSDGSWPDVPVGTQGGGDGHVFSADATIDQNDWTLVSANTSTVSVFRKNATGTGVDAASYDAAGNAWSSMSAAPPLFGAGQAFKSGAGLFGATDGTNIWLFAINTDTANSILCSKYDGASWSYWAAVPGTGNGTHSRGYIAGYRVASRNQIGLIWTEGTSPYDVVTTSLNTGSVADTTPPVVSLTAPADGSTVFDIVSLAATATDNVGVASVQFQIDGINLGPQLATAPYTISWDTTAATNGAHAIGAVAQDAAGNTSASSVSVTVANVADTTPPVISGVTAFSITASSASISWSTNEAATSQVEYGGSINYGSSTVLDPTLATLHVVALSGLNAGTTYHYRADSADAAGNLATSTDFTFTTPDTTPPAVSITAPVDGSIVSGTVLASANATDDVGVVGVQFKLDGANLGTEATAAPYTVSWETTATVNGGHSLTAVARDAAGNATTATAVTVTVNNVDSTPPTVSMSAPSNGATVSGTAVQVSASASDNVAVVGVQFLLDGNALGAEITTAPYTVSWNTTTTTNGTHALAARARDGANNQATSTPISVTVSNATAPIIDVTVSADQSIAQKATATTSAFSTSAPNELLLAFVSADFLSGSNTTVTGVSGAGLTWVLVKRTNSQKGTSEIWRAFTPAPLSNVTVTATLSQAVVSSLTVVSFSNVDTSGTNGSGAIGATASGNASSGAPTATLVTTRNNSWVYGVGNDFDNAIARTVGPNQTLVHQYLAPVGDTYWVQRTTTSVPASATTVTINDTAPTGDRYNLTICEIRSPQ